MNELKEISASEILVATSMEDYATLLQTQRRNERLELDALKSSVAFTIIKNHLGKMLDEHEANFNRTGQFESVEFASDYIEAASAAQALGRKVNLINDVQDWMNSQDSLPFPR